jgi:hypothetical protein
MSHRPLFHHYPIIVGARFRSGTTNHAYITNSVVNYNVFVKICDLRVPCCCGVANIARINSEVSVA